MEKNVQNIKKDDLNKLGFLKNSRLCRNKACANYTEHIKNRCAALNTVSDVSKDEDCWAYRPKGGPDAIRY